MEYELTPVKLPERVGRVKSMTKSTTNEVQKTSKKYAKTRGEHYKDIVIAVLVTAVIAFIGGMHFSNQHNAETARAVQAATAQAETVKK